MGIWLEPPDDGRGFRLIGSGPQRAGADALSTAPRTSSSNASSLPLSPLPAANRPDAAGKTAPRGAQTLGSFTARFEIS